MASGQEHDKATKQWVVPFAWSVGLLIDTRSGVISGIAFLLGGLWLSPDLDTHSNALKRWGMLKILWWPYQKIIRHRSIFSHGPFIGTIIRISYLIIIGNFILYLAGILGFSDAFMTIDLLQKIIQTNQKNLLVAFLGLEASAWLHVIKDGDPLPK